MTVQPRRMPVNPANLEKDDISIATCKEVITCNNEELQRFL